MSNVYNLEPHAYGLISIETTFGNLEVELFTKQCPRATRNFVQLCLDGYYEGTLFERIEKNFIAVGGENIYEEIQEPFPDEFHSRLRFTRRGLLATANTKKNDNGPKFFFTLGPTPELQNKHTLFGRVKGNSVYTLVDLNDCQVNEDYRPYHEQKIIRTNVIENPFDDMKPSKSKSGAKTKLETDSSSESDYEITPAFKLPDSVSTKKLKFHEDDDDSGDESNNKEKKEVNIKHRSTKTSEKRVKLDLEATSDDNSSLNQKEEEFDGIASQKSPTKDKPMELAQDGANDEEELDPKERRLREIRAQIENIKRQIESGLETRTLSDRRKDSKSKIDQTEGSHSPIVANEPGGESIQVKIATRGKNREQETLELLTKFKKKLKQVSKETKKSSRGSIEQEFPADLEDDLASLDRVDGDEWLRHKFEASDDIRLAKDANTKDEDWYRAEDHRSREHRSSRHHDQSHHRSSKSSDSSRRHRSHHSYER